MSCDISTQTANELEGALLPLMRLAGDGLVTEKNISPLIYSLREHFMQSYKFGVISTYGMMDYNLLQHLNLLSGEIDSSLDPQTGERSYRLTANGRSSADMYLGRLREKNMKAYEALRDAASIVRSCR
jgi:hypothetical protein